MEFKLILKKLNGSLSVEEAAIFDKWIEESPRHAAYFEKVRAESGRNPGRVDSDRAWLKIERRLNRKKYRVWRYAAAAAVAGIIVSAFLFNKSLRDPWNAGTTAEVVQFDLGIGTDKAVLTLTDGREVALGQGDAQNLAHASTDGKEIVYRTTYAPKTVRPEFNYLTVPKGGQFSVALSDGTQVWLNSESKLKYPVAFILGDTREVELLYGEAYFEVSPSGEHQGSKFKVVTGAQEVTVLGTQFNIKAYRDEPAIWTTLVEGSIEVEVGEQRRTLDPREQSRVQAGSNQIEVANVDVYSATSWKKGIFSFNDMSLGEIMKVLARWYDIEVIFNRPRLKDNTFTGVLRKNQHIEIILESIKTTTNMNYEIKEKTVIFK